MITQERLKELLSYDPQTGLFTWLMDKGSARKGALAGKLNTASYVQIQLDKRMYLAHRLVWLYIYGAFPACVIDHIDGDKNNNAFSNLREATATENQRNKRKFRGKYLKGVTKVRNSYNAFIRYDKKKQYLGCFKTEQEAYQAYCLAAQKHFGEFANFGYGVYGEPDLAVKAI